MNEIKAIHPPALKPGGTIGVMAPSSWVEREDIEASVRILKDRGYHVFVHPQTYERHNQSAGTTLQKALAFQGLWQRDDIHAIWAAGGGNRALHLIDALNFKHIARKPKLCIGFSDVTAVLNALYAHVGITSIHGQVFKNVHCYKHMDHLLDLLSGKDVSYPLDDCEVWKEGAASGPLIGGNLSVFHFLPNNLSGNFWKGAILYLEDCNEEWNHVDRMFLRLKHTGVLKDISGLIIGNFSGMKDSGRPYGFSLKDIVMEHMDDVDIPIVANFPFGHIDDFYAFPNGAKAVLETSPLIFNVQ